MKTMFLLKVLGVLLLLAVVIWTLDFSVNRFRQISIIDSINVSSSTNPTDGGSGTSTNGTTNPDATSTNPDTNPVTNPVTNNSALVGTKWSWVKTNLSAGDVLMGPAGNKFVLTLKSDKTVQSTTDCNSLGGNYVIDGEVLSFGPFVQTMMYCEGSKETDYARQLSLTSSYTIVGDELRLNLYKDYGVMVFKKI
jgi:heat shock protein HslJ